MYVITKVFQDNHVSLISDNKVYLAVYHTIVQQRITVYSLPTTTPLIQIRLHGIYFGPKLTHVRKDERLDLCV